MKRTNEQISKNKDKGSSKDKKIECFNCGGLGLHYANDCLNLKDIKKSMQAIWSDTDSKKSVSIASEDATYDPNNFFSFYCFYGICADSDSDDEFTNEQKAEFLSNLVVAHEKLIKSYLKIMIFLKLIKTRLMEKILIYLKKKLDFLSLNITPSLIIIMLSLKRSTLVSLFHL